MKLTTHTHIVSGMRMVKVKFALEQGMKAQSGRRGMALLFL